MKKYLKYSSNILLLFASMFVVGCGNVTSSNPTPTPSTPPSSSSSEETTILDALDQSRPTGEDFDYESDYVTPEPPEPEIKVELIEDPAYKNGGKTTKYRLEAECAEIDYKNETNDSYKNTYSDYYNLAFSPLLSNNLATRNLNNSVDTTITFNFTSDKAYKVKFNLMISVWDENHCPFKVSDYIKMSNEGKFKNELSSYDVDLSKTTIAWEETQILVDGGDVNPLYWHFKEVELFTNIYEGANTLTISMIGAGGANLDYLEFDTSAKITGFDNNHYMEDENESSRWYISSKPSDTSEGTITVEKMFDGVLRKYSYGLPAIKDADGKINPLYTEKDFGNGDIGYTFKVKNKTLEIRYNQNTTITLKDYPKVKFANGTATLTKPSGSILTYADFALCEGDRKVSRFNVFDGSNKNIGSAIPESFVIPDENISLEAVTYIRDGFTLLDPGSEQGDRCAQVRPEGTSFLEDNFTNTATNNQIIKGGNDGYDETGVIMGYNGLIPDGGIFRVNTVVNKSSKVITLNKEHQFAYNFENKGTSDIKLQVHQVNSGASTEDGDEGLLLELAPGESVSILIKIKFAKGGANNNALTLFKALSDVNNMKLGMSMSCKLG